MDRTLAATSQDLGTRQDLFPNTTVAGFYDPLSQTIAVPSYDSATLDAARDTGHFLLAANDFFATALHEVTHWLDHTSTLWGQGLLVDIHQAVAAYLGQQESEFWRIASLDSRMRREALAAYYTIIDQPGLAPGNAETWSWRISCGLEFGSDGRAREDRPIVFVSFFDADNERIARIPLTVAALLETSAMWSEQWVHAEILSTLDPEVGHDLGASLAVTEQTELYLPTLTLYSVAAHLAASVLQIEAPAVAFRITAALSSVVLNASDRCFDELVVDEELRAIFGERIDALLAMRDPGLLFLVLVRAARPFQDSVAVEDWLEETCLRAGLPTLTEIRQEAQAVIRSLPDALPAGPVGERAAALLAIGRGNMERRGLCPQREPSVQTLSDRGDYTLPPIILKDDRMVAFPPNTITAQVLSVESSLRMATQYERWERDFLSACRH